MFQTTLFFLHYLLAYAYFSSGIDSFFWKERTNFRSLIRFWIEEIGKSDQEFREKMMMMIWYDSNFLKAKEKSIIGGKRGGARWCEKNFWNDQNDVAIWENRNEITTNYLQVWHYKTSEKSEDKEAGSLHFWFFQRFLWIFIFEESEMNNIWNAEAKLQCLRISVHFLDLRVSFDC